MRKNIIYLLTCLVTMAVSAGLVSCSSDDDGLDSPIAKEIIGTWYASDNSVNRECTVTFYSDGTLNVHVRKLREKLEEDPNDPKMIKTIWGTGYILEI